MKGILSFVIFLAFMAGCKKEKEPSNVLSLLLVSALSGETEPCGCSIRPRGGIERISSLNRKLSQHSLVLHGPLLDPEKDSIQNTKLYENFKRKTAVLNPKIVGLSTKDFDIGLSQIEKWQKDWNTTFLSSQLKCNETKVQRQHTEIKGDTKYVFIALSSAEISDGAVADLRNRKCQYVSPLKAATEIRQLQAKQLGPSSRNPIYLIIGDIDAKSRDSLRKIFVDNEQVAFLGSAIPVALAYLRQVSDHQILIEQAHRGMQVASLKITPSTVLQDGFRIIHSLDPVTPEPLYSRVQFKFYELIK